jgi:N-carbamoyl-L-amino-acid hydrolase
VYGVLAGLEVIRTLNDIGYATRSPLELVVWTNEEGARFAPAMMGSGVWADEFTTEECHATHDKSGTTVAGELERIGYNGHDNIEHSEIAAAFEVHIEQGPILEAEGKQVGTVTGVQGMRWYDIIIRGEACHAGPTPMESRQDPMRTLSQILTQLYGLADSQSPWGRITFGDQTVHPGSRNTVPESVTLAVDMRHPEQHILDQMHESLLTIVSKAGQATNTTTEVVEQWHSPAVKFADNCVSAVRAACTNLGYPQMDIVSGAGHDSVYVSRHVPTSMIFIPCEKGLSHNEAERAEPEDLAAGCNVLLHAMLVLDAH